MNQDKPHYYDGKPYQFLFDKALKEVREIIIGQIKPNTIVIDLCCGTGALVFDLADRCTSVTGVELSSKMIAHAEKSKRISGKKNIQFFHADASHLNTITDKQYDYATISMALHEMPCEMRLKVLQEAKRISKKIIIADYAVPQPCTLAGGSVYFIEFFAGMEHFRGFRNFQKNKGIHSLLEKCGYKIKVERKNTKGTIQVILANYS
ncbi:class I SAM-dependent methyltransferase [Candidatus Woesearchaeota archaeon]|nr:class I SAM-dependent methyltransferase [Candidatus Woesearchaeota archaeon]